MFLLFPFFLLLLNAVVFPANAMEDQLTPKAVVTRTNQSEAIQPCQVGASENSQLDALEGSSVLIFQQLPLDILNYLASFLYQRTLVKLSKTSKFFYRLIDSAKIYGAFKKAAISGKWYLPMEPNNAQPVNHDISRGEFYAVVSQSNIDLLKIFFRRKLGFSSIIPYASAIRIAAHNGFEEGVNFLIECSKLSHLTLRQCQELIPALIFPLTSDLLLAAIYYADTDEIRAILFSEQFFICANNEYVSQRLSLMLFI